MNVEELFVEISKQSKLDYHGTDPDHPEYEVAAEDSDTLIKIKTVRWEHSRQLLVLELE